ncbi:MAG: penicillin-binding protein 2 [Candidatus Paceibacterota bacterium]|jgi:cell division protein FtsI/penicillin-binding protein 2
MKSRFLFRIRFFSLAIIAFALFLVGRLYFLQIMHGSDFVSKADRQYVRPAAYVFNRGNIFFSSKDGGLISAATVKDGSIVALNPKIIQTPENICTKLTLFLTLNCSDVTAKASKTNDPYEEIAKHVDVNIGKAINALKIPGVGIYQDRWRIYPGGTLASQVLGFVGYKGDELGGRYGLESYYENVLKREDQNVYVNFFAEIFSDINKTVIQGESLEGDVVTTIEPTTQDFLEKALEKVKTKWSSESVGGIIINPKNGEIYAMALTPGFDPNNFRDAQDVSVFTNDVVENVHEMGSIIKPITMATAIDLGVANASTTYLDTGSVSLNGKTIYNFDKKGRGTITLQQAMGESLNTGFVFLSQKIGHDNFRKYFTDFGLGERTGIDLPNEAKGIITTNLNSPRDLEYGTASFGQGIAITPVETVRALSAIANGGTLITPHVAKQINYKIGIPKTISYPEGRRVIKKETADAVTEMLVTDFDQYFQKGASKNPHYRIAEKTGTAQIPLPGGGYYEDRNLHSFFGFLPASNPQFLVFLYTVNPHGAPYSSVSLGPTFVDITKFLINYYEIAPDR